MLGVGLCISWASLQPRIRVVFDNYAPYCVTASNNGPSYPGVSTGPVMCPCLDRLRRYEENQLAAAPWHASSLVHKNSKARNAHHDDTWRNTTVQC